MIMKALSDYYDLLSSQEDSGIARPGYSQLGVNFAAVLSTDGDLLQLVPLKFQEYRGKKAVERPQQMQLPQQVKKTVGFVSNTCYENATYVFGLDSTGKPERAKRCFETFRAQQHLVLDGTDCPQAYALLQFVDRWEPAAAAQHPVLLTYMDELVKGGNIVFRLEGGGYIHTAPAVRQAWDNYQNSANDTSVMQCLVTGRRGPIARLHPSIKGIRGAASTGAALVSFNDRAYESYGYEKKQGLNAPVGEATVFAYTTALNYLIADSTHKFYVSDTTVVFWAQSPQKIYTSVFALQVDPGPLYREMNDGMSVDDATASAARRFFEKISQGKPAERFEESLEDGVQFYVLGLAPNVARASVRFFMNNTFGGFSQNLARHHRDMYLPRYSDREPEFYSLDWILKETVAPTSKEKSASPLMSGAAMRAILTGTPYPASLYQMTLLRIKAERNINRCKAGIIKAYLTRKYPNENSYKEVLQVALNETSENRAYRLGRLFSILEKAQLEAAPEINATIKDRYFTSACAAPKTVFPTLLRLAQHHISKLDYQIKYEKQIGEILSALEVEAEPFPAHLSLDDQGIFILGYYHQRTANYTPVQNVENIN